MKKKITMWWLNKEGKLSFNHYEDGWIDSLTPTVKFDSQKGWLKAHWNKAFGYEITQDDGRKILTKEEVK